MRTNSVGGLLGTRDIGHAGIVGDVSRLLDKFVGLRVVASVTGSGILGSAVQNKLNGEINVVALRLAGNLDTIRQGTQSTVGPATSAVLKYECDRQVEKEIRK